MGGGDINADGSGGGSGGGKKINQDIKRSKARDIWNPLG
jgi:hypothetical protein